MEYMTAKPHSAASCGLGAPAITTFLGLFLLFSPLATGLGVFPAGGPSGETRVILVLGDSLAAGYGLDPSQAFPALLQEKIDALGSGYGYQVVNAGISGDTSASGRRRIDWLLHRRVDVLILELGANDGLRGVPLEETRSNLQQIVDRTRQRYPDAKVVLAGMQVPPNMGPDYTSGFAAIFPELARKNGVALVPFLLEGVAGRRDLNLPDGIHPTAEGHRIVAENVWKVLRPLLVPVSGP